MIINELTKAQKHLSKHDPLLRTLIKKYGNCNLQPTKKYFNALLDSIISQQLSTSSAKAISNKFYSYFGANFKPEIILEESFENLRALGLSNSKTVYIKDLSEKILDKSISFRGIAGKTDDEIISMLTSVKGIGVWTSHMFLIFSLARLDILPVGDYGIKKAVMLNYGLEELPGDTEISDIAEKFNWTPYRTVASWYLWKSLNNK